MVCVGTLRRQTTIANHAPARRVGTALARLWDADMRRKSRAKGGLCGKCADFLDICAIMRKGVAVSPRRGGNGKTVIF